MQQIITLRLRISIEADLDEAPDQTNGELIDGVGKRRGRPPKTDAKSRQPPLAPVIALESAAT